MTLPIDPVVPAFPAGYEPFPADFTAWVTTPFSFLASPPAFRGTLTTATAIGAGATVLAPINSVAEDPYNGWSATATGSQPAHSWLCPPGCSGWYDVTLSGLTNASSSTTSVVKAVLALSGVQYAQVAAGWQPNGHSAGASGGCQVPMLGGIDYLQMYLFSGVAVNTPTTTGQLPTMELAWISQ